MPHSAPVALPAAFQFFMTSERPRGIRPRRPRGVRQRTAANTFHGIQSIQAGDVVLLVARGSRPTQQPNLESELEALAEAVRRRGARPVTDASVSKRIGRGYDNDADQEPWSTWLANVADTARREGCDMVLAETVDRFVRHPQYSNRQQHWVAGTSQLLRVRRATDGMKLVTLAAPTASPSENRSVQTSRGIRAAAPPPPGHKKCFRKHAKPTAQQLGKRNWSLQEIKEIVEFKYSGKTTRETIRRWVNDGDA